MKQVLHICLCFMISLGQAREDPILQEDGTPDTHQAPRQLKAPGILGNLKSIYEAAELKYPYVDEKCCNISTTYVCSRMGSDGFRGHCMPRNETCLGKEFFGSRYCVISNLKSCKCCVPTDCLKQTLAPCTKLNGTCIGLKDHCNGTSVVSEEFCKKDSRNDTCKCCFPLVEEADCPCGQDYKGNCVGRASNGNKKKGHCMKTCDRGTVPLRDNTCNTTGGNDCKCCAPIECSKGCFRIGSQCFMRDVYNYPEWYSGNKTCIHYANTTVAEPQDPQALSQYLATNYPDDSTYWIGAHGTSNGNAAWASGDVIGPDAPWFANSYATCNNPNWYMYLQANAGCYISNQCLGCWKLNQSGGTPRKVICSCDKNEEIEI